jgi:hypothetical protein
MILFFNIKRLFYIKIYKNMNTIGYLSNIIGYIYDNKNYVLLQHIQNKKYEFNKSYALISYNIINNYGYDDESLLKIISFIKNININEFNELTYEIILSNKKELYINDSCNLCTFIKEKYQLENIYDSPQFIIEYTEKESEYISQLFYQLLVNHEISKYHNQKMNILIKQIKELEKELDEIENEKNKNIFEEFTKKEYFIKSKL